MTHIRDRLYLDVEAERLRQEQLWGVQHHSPQKWLSILAEEFGEVAKAINEHDERELRAEVLECCAVALAWAEDIDAGPHSEDESWFVYHRRSATCIAEFSTRDGAEEEASRHRHFNPKEKYEVLSFEKAS